MRALVVAAVVLAPALAAAEPNEPSFELRDRGDAVEVIAHNVKATHTIVNPIRSRLEVPIAGRPSIKRELPTDATVKVIELADEDSTKVLSVKLGFERADVKALARFAQAVQVGDDLHLLFPRKVPAEGELAKLPEPTLPAKIAAIAPPVVNAEPPVSNDKPAAKPIEPEPKPIVATDTKPAPAATLGAPEQSDAWSKVTTYGAIGLAAAGVGVWLMRRKKAQPSAVQSIELIAQRSLGPKAKMMWLAAGERELIVSVTPQHVRMLGSWPRGSSQVPTMMARQHTQEIPTAHATIATPRTTTQNRSPAVNGILRLRAQTVQPINEDVATDDVDADALWAREILAAAGGKR